MTVVSGVGNIFDAIAGLKPGAIPPLDAPTTAEAILRAVKAMQA